MRAWHVVAALFLPLGVLTQAGSAGRAPSEAQYTIAFASFAPLNMDVFIAEGDGTNTRPLLSHPDQDYNASFSRDGEWIVFTSERDGSADLYRVHPDGSGFEPLVSNPAFDDQAALSPDGRFLAFVSNRSGQADIWSLELETKRLRNLTNHREGDFRPAWSPDGSWIAFSSSRDSTKPNPNFAIQLSTEIYVMRADGSDVRRITHGQAFAGGPAWSADGTQLAIYQAALVETARTTSPGRRGRGTFQIVAIELATGAQHVLTSGAGEKWSPRWLTNDRIGYVSRDGMEFTSGGTGARGEFRSPSWSADGRRVVFHRDVDALWPPYRRWHSRDPRFSLIRSGIFPSYAPRGDRLVINDGLAGIMHNSLVVMNADGSSRSTIYTHPTRSALAPVWSREGDKIVFALGGFFQMMPAQVQPRSNADIAVVHSDGTNFELLTDGTGNFAFPSWSPDGRQLVYRAYGGSAPGLFIMDVQTRKARPLLIGPHNFPTWSPKGDRIAFTSNRDHDYEIYTIKPDGTGLTRLTSSPGNDGHLTWSSDGEWIAFASERAGFKDESALHVGNAQPGGDIYVMRGNGSDVRQLTDDQFEEATPGWVPLKVNRKPGL